MRMTEEEKYGLTLLTNAVGLRNSPVADLFECSIGRIFVRHVRSLMPATVGSFDSTRLRWAQFARDYLGDNMDDITHVCDWLSTAMRECYPWMLRQDDQHRPLKLMKCGTLERLVHEANKAEDRLHQRQPHFLSLSSADERWELDLGAGYSLVRLLTTDALDVEGDRLRHCIGHGAYDEDLHESEHEFYSVRDGDSAPRATLQIVPRLVDGERYGQVRQFVGRRNARPEAHVQDLIAGVMTSMRWIERPTTKSTIAAPRPAAF